MGAVAKDVAGNVRDGATELANKVGDLTGEVKGWFDAEGGDDATRRARGAARSPDGSDDEDGESTSLEINTIRLGRGDYFGEYAIILEPNKSKHPATVRAVTFCELFSLSYDDFQNLLPYFPALQESVLTLGRRRYQQMMKALNADGTQNVVFRQVGGCANQSRQNRADRTPEHQNIRTGRIPSGG